MLYMRMLFSMVVSLYTSRVVLNVLGVEDYGIYNVVGGFVSMFSLISGSLSAAISRFLTFELGRGDNKRLASIFSTSLVVQLVLAVVIVMLLESVGVWFLNHKMVIPVDRMVAANWLLQISIVSFALSLLSVPYNASIVSHEHMHVYAYIGILDVVARLFIVLILGWLPSSIDKLIWFSMMLLGVGVVLQMIYWSYCRRHFEECRSSLRLEKSLLKEMMGFAGWNFIGASSAILREQGCNVVLNLFWGPALNAARGIAQQVNNAIGGFVGNFMTALNPQITKSYAAGESEYTMSLIYKAARFSYYLLLIFSLPMLLNTDYLIHLWLGQVPEHVVLYVRLILVFSLCETVSNPLVTVMLATGNIRNYQIIVGGLQILNLPISYVLLKLGFFPEIVTVVAIVLSLCCLAARLVMLRGMIGLSISTYINKVILNLLVVTISSAILPILAFGVSEANLLNFVISTLLSIICAGLSVYLIGCSRTERIFIREKASSVLSRFSSHD